MRWPFGDRALEACAWTGLALSGALVAWPVALGCVLPLALWGLYLSVVNLGQHFVMGYGWEWQVCETLWLAIFLAPMAPPLLVRAVSSPNGKRASSSAALLLPRWDRAPVLVVWLVRWMAFRLMLGAGMSKLGRGASKCWRPEGGFSCTTTHYETQPNPNPVAWYMHHLPAWVHVAEVLPVGDSAERTLFHHIERAALHGYGPDAHSCR